MEDPDFILQQRLTNIYEDFILGLDEQMSLLNDIWKKGRLKRNNSGELSRLKDIAHELAISSAPFNLFVTADKAHQLEIFLAYLSESSNPAKELHRQQVDLLIQSLAATAADTGFLEHQVIPRRWEPAVVIPELNGDKPYIYILDTNHLWAEQITSLLHGAYRVKLFQTLTAMTRTLVEFTPKLIITDVMLDYRQTQELASGDQGEIDISHIPVIFIARDNNIGTRLLSVRSYAAGYFILPLDTERVAEKIRELTTGVPKDPYRVMIINDDAPMARFMALALGQEGMNVTIVDNPDAILEHIHRHRTELILMNMSMPACSGLELTRIIRQEEYFAGIAIVFLSIDGDQVKQLDAIKSGGDDFITLPVDQEYLVAMVSSRVRRARTLNTMNYNLSNALRELENQQFALDQHAIVSITNINGSIIYVNDKLCEISGYTRSELIGKDHRILKSGVHDQKYFKDMWSTISKGVVWHGEICNRKKNGDLYWVDVTIVPFIDKQSRPYQFVAINSDITAKKFTEKDLLEARDVALNASQAKSEFLSKMSHELRTPLNAVLGFSQLLETSREHNLSGNQLEFISEIHNAGNHLLNLINEVLDLSRIEANELYTENVNIDLSAFLDECIALILPGASHNNINISTLYKHTGDVVVHADPMRLKQVMTNLLSNAVKYNRPSGMVIIDTRQERDETIIIEVTDSGAGIGEDQIDMLFHPFIRLPQHKKIEGVGIGLALSKRLIELMGGRIGVHSVPGERTTFWVEVNTAVPGLGEVRTVFNDADPEPVLPAKTTPATLLYIEDNETNLLLVRELIAERENLNLRHAATMASGIESAKMHHPQIILMDLELPDMNGFDGITLIKKDKTLDSIPVIAISAYADEENIQRALRSGFTEYITKPIDINRFHAVIDKYR